MRRIGVLLFMLGMFCAEAHATHPVQISWIASTSQPKSYNVYRAPCNGTVIAGTCSNEGVFVLIFNTTQLSYTDGTVNGSTQWAYYVTALCDPVGGCPDGTTGESVASTHIAVIIPQDTDSSGGVF